MKTRTTICAALAVVALTGAGIAAARMGESPAPVVSSSQWQLLRTADGTLIEDAFTEAIPSRDVQDVYEFNGDTDPSRTFVKATEGGLVVGADPPPTADTHTGWFAVTIDAYPRTSIFHVRMSKPPGNVQGHDEAGQAVFAVQTASTKVTGLINFVEVTTSSSGGKTSWQIDYSFGHVVDAQNILYWSTEPSENAADTEEVTLRTDGRRSLTVWLGDEQVFHSDQLELDIQAPFQPYLEVQALQTPYFASFQDFWVVEDTWMRLTGLPAGADVRLVNDEGGVLGGAAASADGTAAVELPPYAAKGSGTLEIARDGHETVRLGPFPYAGGDELQLVAK
ncbi:hypothetical protein QFZ30_000776 [Arthrobacter pascens]|uniref:hypothetical protein n=1 Tax=Arthrobacter pascens TaxID=1677 RepID=UPI002794894E|nr:hypothetical protein [Arthrobacter pascens]MDQ0677394.1 hypothetical protein [Arthrobacter pascens]